MARHAPQHRPGGDNLSFLWSLAWPMLAAFAVASVVSIALVALGPA